MNKIRFQNERAVRGEVLGTLTGVSLRDVSPLMLPWEQDPWGIMRPPLSSNAMKLSAELAAATYHMEVERWLQAGWQDVTIQVDNELVTDFVPIHRSDAMKRFAAALQLQRIRSRMKQRNPFGQVVGALRQIRQSDTGKVLVMLHPAPGNRCVVAVSFMGTGSRFYDWFSNFRMTSQDGVHKGFLQLSRQFEGNEPHIQFPNTAQALGLNKLSLRDILLEAARPNSRFILWVSGHSQGGAVLQVWVRHKLLEDGVLPAHMVGYGFASPSALEARAVEHPEIYPLYHIFNSDDVVPRMGAQVHLGQCLIYPANEEFRARCYAWSADEASIQRRAEIRPLLESMTDTPSCIIMALGYLEALEGKTQEDVLAGFQVLGLKHLPLGRVLNAADSRMDDLLHFICRHVRAAYQSITGQEADSSAIDAARFAIEARMDAMGTKAFSSSLMELMSWPHSIRSAGSSYMGAYLYIVLYGKKKLQPFVWAGGKHPARRYAASSAQEPASDGKLVARRRMMPEKRRIPTTKPRTHAGAGARQASRTKTIALRQKEGDSG